MASQTFVFVVLPNGHAPGNRLRLSLYFAPRLDGGGTLAAFPDVLRWPANIHDHGLDFKLSCGGRTLTVPANRAALRPDAWHQLFTADTFVQAVRFPDYGERLVVSYPLRSALSYLKYAHQAVATGAAVDREGQGLRVLLDPLSFRKGRASLLDEELAHMRVAMWTEQQRQLAPIARPPGGESSGLLVATMVVGPQQTPSPDGVPSTATLPADARDTATRFALFHRMPPAPGAPPLPRTEDDFKETLDFHRALTALSSYPALLRALGLVFDVEVPADFCPDSPAGGAYGEVKVTALAPRFSWSMAPTLGAPATAYVRDAATFAAAPAAPPGAAPWPVAGGFLALPGDAFHLLQVDLDGGLLKALTLADNIALTHNREVIGDTLPSLRSAGVGLVANGRALQLLKTIHDNAALDAALDDGASFPRALTADDVTRGLRLDVWSSRTGRWHSLHRRSAAFRLGAQRQLHVDVKDEEGFLQPAAAQPAADPTRPTDPVAEAAGAPQPGTDLYLHERVARWDGWSLSAPRPGKALNRDVDPAKALDADPTVGEPLTPFKMTSAFTVTPGSLPELRFGARYRVRARTVDLAGNSVPLATPAGDAFALPAGGRELPYLRFEPVSPPILVEERKPDRGGSLERMVIRSLNAGAPADAVRSGDADHRHVAPPRTSARMAETHGALDYAHGKLGGDKATFDMIVARDAYVLPEVDGAPMVPQPTLTVGYLPDPIARGAALRSLPGAADDTDGRIEHGALVYARLPGVEPRPDSVTYVDFGPGWPGRTAFRLTLIEGSAAPRWDAARRELTVSLRKSEVRTVDLSSYLEPADLTLMGVWSWLCERFELDELLGLESAEARYALGEQSNRVALLTRLALEGGHASLTPSRLVTLVHAVQQPLGHPEFVQLPVVHQPTAPGPVLASVLRNSFTPITAWRAAASHSASLLGGLQIHAKSSAQIDLRATWSEAVDDLSRPAPERVAHAAHVDTISLADTSGGPIAADAAGTRNVAVYVPEVDTLWFAAPFDELGGVTAPFEVAAPLHRFDDTRHRWVTYAAIATSRFQEYFAPGLDFTREGAPLVVDVPSSAPPAPPEIAYVVPIFGWQTEERTNVKSSLRFGNGLRVYLQRPWFSSGDDELLGVVTWSGAAPTAEERDAEKPHFTQWGVDPIWTAGSLADVPDASSFSNAVASARGLSVPGSTRRYDVAAHAVVFDEERKLWFADVELVDADTYCPFVRLALARYQAHSITGVELSRVVLADFAQLTPDRSAVLTIQPTDSRVARLFVGGLSPDAGAASLTSIIEVTVEERVPGIHSDLAWRPASPAEVKVEETSPDATEPQSVLWSGTIRFAAAPKPSVYRVVVREFERLPVQRSQLPERLELAGGQRLVYAAILPYDYPSP